MSMVSIPATIDGDTYKCIMSVTDILNMFVHLCHQHIKESCEEAENLLSVFAVNRVPQELYSMK